MIAASVPGLLLLLLGALQVLLAPGMCTDIVKKYAPRYIDGNLEASSISVSLFRNFPAVTANIEDMVITYPGDRFDSLEIAGAQHPLVYAGTCRARGAEGRPAGPDIDTLACFERFTAAINVLSLIKGEINLKKVELEHPLLFVHFYEGGRTNLETIKLPEDEDKEQDDSSLPDILLRKVHLGSRASIAYSSQEDTVMARMFLRNLSFDGHFRTGDPLEGRFRFSLDTLFVFGSAAGDTLLFNLDHLRVKDRRGDMTIDAEAVAHAGTRSFGRIKVPVALSGNVAVSRQDSTWLFDSRDVRLNVATLEALMDMKVSAGERLSLDGHIGIPDFDIKKFMDNYAANFYPDAAKIGTDAHLKASLEVCGDYDSASGLLPAFDAKVDIARCSITHSDLPLKPSFELHASSRGEQSGPIEARIASLKLSCDGLDVNVSGNLEKAPGTGPVVDMNAFLEASLAPLCRSFAGRTDISASGNVSAEASGTIDLDRFSLYNPDSFDLKAKLSMSDIRAASSDDSLNLYLDTLNLRVALMDDRFNPGGKSSAKAVGAILKADSLSFRYGNDVNVSGRSLGILAQSSSVRMNLPDGTSYNPLHARVSMGSLSFEGRDSLAVRLKNSVNGIKFSPDRKSGAPRLSLSSENERVRVKSGVHRAFLKNLGFSAEARLNQGRDTILKRHHSDSTRRRRTPGKWLSEEDFRQADIHLDLGETFRKYFTQWNVEGTLSLGRGAVATPAFPLRTALTGFKGSFNNNTVKLDTLRIVSGGSNLSAHGEVTNLRRVLTGSGMVRTAIEVDTDSLALSEILAAYALGQKNMHSDLAYLASLDDDSYENKVAAATVDSTISTPLIVVPANVDATLALRGRGVSYLDLNVSDVSADLIMKRRCLQLNSVRAVTTVGNIYADAFYSTLTKEEIYAGFNVNLEDIAVGDVIDLVPQVDTLMPLLKSFDGLLNCNLAATTRLDTTMNLIMPSMEGILRLSGRNLHFNDNRQVTKIASMLRIRHPETATVDSMMVEGILRDNTLEIFPFLLAIDRWKVALAGVQNMDQSFSYHLSLVKTPLILKLGANVYGDDFDHMKFSLGKAKYRDERSLPSFSSVIDTTRINLVESIRNVFEYGVKQAVRDNGERNARLDAERKKRGYSRSAALEAIDSLSTAELVQLDSLSVAPTSDDTIK